MGFKYRPSKKAIQEYSNQMKRIEAFCVENGIQSSASKDSYYFSINGQSYRVSNHTIEASNARAYNFEGERVRELYHSEGRNSNVIYIHAGKTRIIEIYNNLKAGYVLDGKGFIKETSPEIAQPKKAEAPQAEQQPQAAAVQRKPLKH